MVVWITLGQKYGTLEHFSPVPRSELMIVHVSWKPDRIVQPASGIPELVGDALQVGRRIENCHGVGMKYTEDCGFFSPGIKICQSVRFLASCFLTKSE